MSARWQQIRAAAAAVRRQYADATGEDVPLALPLECLVDDLFGLSAFEDLSLDQRINGELDTAHDTIRLRPGMPPARRRFIIAHEVGHFVLEDATNALFQDDDSTIDDRAGGDLESEAGVVRVYNTRERREVEANLFALELLIPAETLWELVQEPGWTVQSLATRFEVSQDAVTTQLVNVCCLEPPVAAPPDTRSSQTIELDEYQQQAIDAPLPTLVVAGPGTGKTRCIVAKYVSLVEQGVDPARILALTFSNKAAEEMRARIIAALSGRPGSGAGRIDVSTFHAWGLNFLKMYGHLIGLPLDVQLRTPGDIYILLKQRLADLPLAEYKMLHDPGFYLLDLIGYVSRIKDELRTPAEYRQLAEIWAEQVVPAAYAETAGQTTKAAQKLRDRAERDARRLRELAAIYERYEAMLREEGVIDYGDLIMRSVEALRMPQVAADVHAQYHYILVDEFQDINYASGVLVQLIDGGRGRVWAVGDPWQSIYRFRGASPANLQEFTQVYPGAQVVPLVYNYRSVQPILDASHAIMAPDSGFADRRPQESRSKAVAGRQVVVERVAESPDVECSAIAHDIIRRVGSRKKGSIVCARTRPQGRFRRVQPRLCDFRRRRWRLRHHVVLCRKHSHVASVVATLEAHGLPVEWVGDILQYPEIKDALAVCAMVHSSDSVEVLRALTVSEHALVEADLHLLVRLAHAEQCSLQRAMRDPAIVAQLSPDGRQAIQRLQQIIAELEVEQDVWRLLTRYLFELSSIMRERLCRAGQGDAVGGRELATLGELILLARNFVRQAPPAAADSSAFIAYVRLLIEAGEVARAPIYGEHADVVRVMTTHASKGLEFPIVYIPTLEEGQFPSRDRGSVIPDLPGLVHGVLGSDLQEERYLLYVAMTRAQERLILSRSQSRGKRGGKRSSLLPGKADGADVPWPLRWLNGGQRCPSATPPVRLTNSALIRMPVPASSMDTYDGCPRRYLYQYGYLLYDDASPYLRMHQTIREAVQELSQLARDGDLPQDEAAVERLVWRIFATHELTDVLYSRDYFEEASQHVRQVWSTLRESNVRPDDVNASYILQRPAGAIAVRVDQVEAGAYGPRWVRLRSGKERDDHHLETRIMLYALAYEQAYGQPPDIAIHYTATGETRSAVPRAKVLADHTAEIDAMLAGIVQGQWQPNPGQDCKTCPFNLICPA